MVYHFFIVHINQSVPGFSFVLGDGEQTDLIIKVEKVTDLPFQSNKSCRKGPGRSKYEEREGKKLTARYPWHQQPPIREQKTRAGDQDVHMERVLQMT